jgi:hypothetical protein
MQSPLLVPRAEQGWGIGTVLRLLGPFKNWHPSSLVGFTRAAGRIYSGEEVSLGGANALLSPIYC